MQKIKGTLIPIGGNEDKGRGETELYTLEFIEDGILARIIAECSVKDPKIVIIPTASSIPVEVGENYKKAFTKLGCTDIHILDIRSKEDAKKPASIELIRSANCIMFSGGDQSKITAKIGNSTIHKIIKNRYQNETGFVIAGTSAGAMAMSEEMIAGGSSTEAFIKGAVNMNKGLGLIPELIIDTHFIQRGRFGRQSEAVARFPELLGIGLAEDTGLIIKKGNEFEVIGSGMIIVFDAANLSHNNEKILKIGTPMTMANLVVHVLAIGDRFNIETRKVKVLPIDAQIPFV
jgi:cyanophycinase